MTEESEYIPNKKLRSWSYFCDEVKRFREIIGSKDKTIEDWDAAWARMLYVYVMCQENEDKAISAIKALQIDYEMRVMCRLGLFPSRKKKTSCEVKTGD